MLCFQLTNLSEEGQYLINISRTPSAPLGSLTSSSGFSSLSPTCSSGTLRRKRVLVGFLRRMEPRDSSVMLWIWGAEGRGEATGKGAAPNGWCQAGARLWLCARCFIC